MTEHKQDIAAFVQEAEAANNRGRETMIERQLNLRQRFETSYALASWLMTGHDIDVETLQAARHGTTYNTHELANAWYRYRARFAISPQPRTSWG